MYTLSLVNVPWSRLFYILIFQVTHGVLLETTKRRVNESPPCFYREHLVALCKHAIHKLHRYSQACSASVSSHLYQPLRVGSPLFSCECKLTPLSHLQWDPFPCLACLTTQSLLIFSLLHSVPTHLGLLPVRIWISAQLGSVGQRAS